MSRLGPDTWSELYDGRVAALLEIGLAAAQRTLDFFQTDRYQVERKKDDSPVTAADRAAEQLIRQRVQAAFGLDGVLGEEFGTLEGSGHYRWIIDPIDGT